MQIGPEYGYYPKTWLEETFSLAKTVFEDQEYPSPKKASNTLKQQFVQKLSSMHMHAKAKKQVGCFNHRVVALIPCLVVYTKVPYCNFEVHL